MSEAVLMEVVVMPAAANKRFYNLNFRKLVLTELDFKNSLDRYYQSIVSKSYSSTEEARVEAALLSKELFDLNKFDLRGTENLPLDTGVVFIYNHISNNKEYILDNDFQITLDSHFISSVISYTYYNTPGIRIVRHGLPSENAHNTYYDKFGYIKVYSKQFLPEKVTPNDIKNWKEKFYLQSKLALENGENLIINPEGKSFSTEDSPGDFKAGVFKMIINSKLDPLVVPLVMVNFDKLNSKTIYRCEIKKPFRLSEIIDDFSSKEQLNDFLISISKKYHQWVKNLRTITPGYTQDIKRLIDQRQNHQHKENLFVFYGSSTFRLWESLAADFDPFNVLNFGFGGSFIEDCINYFDSLFAEINPVALVLYVGGNDLSLGYSTKKINELFKKLLDRIQSKFPATHVFCVSIKPSGHRIEHLDKIRRLNQLMENELVKIQNAVYINIFDSFFDQNDTIIDDYFLIDNLHLSSSGYAVWQEKIYSAIQNKFPHLIKKT